MSKEILSQLIDGELSIKDANIAIKELITSPEQQQYWHALHTARAVMQKDDVCVTANLAERVSLLLESETAIVAPNNLVAVKRLDLNANSIGHPSGNNIASFKLKRSKLAGYMAIAASLALLVVFICSQPQAPMEASLSHTAPNGQAALELQSMVVQHGEFTGVAALNGLSAYAKVVNSSLYEKTP